MFQGMAASSAQQLLIIVGRRDQLLDLPRGQPACSPRLWGGGEGTPVEGKFLCWGMHIEVKMAPGEGPAQARKEPEKRLVRLKESLLFSKPELYIQTSAKAHRLFCFCHALLNAGCGLQPWWGNETQNFCISGLALVGLIGMGAGWWPPRLDLVHSGIQLRNLLTGETPGTWGQRLVFTLVSLKSSYAWVPTTLFSRLGGRIPFPPATLCVLNARKRKLPFAHGILMISLPSHRTKESD